MAPTWGVPVLFVLNIRSLVDNLVEALILPNKSFFQMYFRNKNMLKLQLFPK